MRKEIPPLALLQIVRDKPGIKFAELRSNLHPQTNHHHALSLAIQDGYIEQGEEHRLYLTSKGQRALSPRRGWRRLRLSIAALALSISATAAVTTTNAKPAEALTYHCYIHWHWVGPAHYPSFGVWWPHQHCYWSLW